MTRTLPSPDAAVIVVDLQTGMFDGVFGPPIHDADRLVERTRRVIAWARETGRKVAFIRHDGSPEDPLAPGKPGWSVWPALGQAPDEPTFSKSVGDAFSNPALATWIEERGAKEVVLLGAQTDQCVAATVKGALACGLAVTVVGDAHGTWDWNGETADQIIARHNASFATAGATVIAAEALTAA